MYFPPSREPPVFSTHLPVFPTSSEHPILFSREDLHVQQDFFLRKTPTPPLTCWSPCFSPSCSRPPWLPSSSSSVSSASSFFPVRHRHRHPPLPECQLPPNPLPRCLRKHCLNYDPRGGETTARVDLTRSSFLQLPRSTAVFFFLFLLLLFLFVIIAIAVLLSILLLLLLFCVLTGISKLMNSDRSVQNNKSSNQQIHVCIFGRVGKKAICCQSHIWKYFPFIGNVVLKEFYEKQ